MFNLTVTEIPLTVKRKEKRNTNLFFSSKILSRPWIDKWFGHDSFWQMSNIIDLKTPAKKNSSFFFTSTLYFRYLRTLLRRIFVKLVRFLWLSLGLPGLLNLIFLRIRINRISINETNFTFSWFTVSSWGMFISELLFKDIYLSKKNNFLMNVLPFLRKKKPTRVVFPWRYPLLGFLNWYKWVFCYLRN